MWGLGLGFRVQGPPLVYQYYSTSKLVALLKKDSASIARAREEDGDAFKLPVRPIGISCALVKAASHAALLELGDLLAPMVGPTRFAVDTKAGTDMIQWAIQVAMEGDDNLAAMSADAVNAFINEQHRKAMRAALLANPALHGLLDMFDMLYGPDAWLYGPAACPPAFELRCRRGVRQGCALSTFLFCLTMAPVYDRIRAMLGDAGALLAFSDGAYCISSSPPLFSWPLSCTSPPRSIAWLACALVGASANPRYGYL